MVKGFILAAGFGERLKPITHTVPKSLIPVLNLPAICYAIFLLKEAGIKHVICNLHYRHKDIIRFFEERHLFGLDISFSIEDTILGTGGGLKKCEQFLKDDEILLINSDIILNIHLASLIDFHQGSSSPATLLLHETDRAGRIGPVGVRDGCVLDFNNILGTGLSSNLIYSGIALLSPEIFGYLNDGFSSVVNTGYVGLINNATLGYYEHKGFWHDIGALDTYWHTNTQVTQEVCSLHERMNETLALYPSIVAPTANIHPGAIINNSIIGENVSIDNDTHIESSVILPDSHVENQREIRNSIVFKDEIIVVNK